MSVAQTALTALTALLALLALLAAGATLKEAQRDSYRRRVERVAEAYWDLYSLKPPVVNEESEPRRLQLQWALLGLEGALPTCAYIVENIGAMPERHEQVKREIAAALHSPAAEQRSGVALLVATELRRRSR